MIMRQGSNCCCPPILFFIWASLIAGHVAQYAAKHGVVGPRAMDSPTCWRWCWCSGPCTNPRASTLVVPLYLVLLMDVHQGGLLGQHAMAYTVLSFFAITIHRRLLWFSVPSQAAQVFPLFFCPGARRRAGSAHAGRGAPFRAFWMLLGPRWWRPCLWPVASIVLLAPATRAPDPDANRPLYDPHAYSLRVCAAPPGGLLAWGGPALRRL
jgi:rod shape-determining protein MreD